MHPLTLLLLCSVVLAADNTLLTLTKSHSCLKDVVFQFVKAQNCTLLLDHQKSQLAIQMTKCLMSNMGKAFPKNCEASISECKLQGDAWSTFSTFYAHIDNLCHFYWQMLHHERAQALISKLSDSSTEAERVLRQNTLQTKKILQIQNQMQTNLQISLTQQQQMSKLIESSAAHVANMTNQIQNFVGNIRQDLNQNYASITNVLKVINQGVQQVIQIQNYMKADITSIHGILYFVAQFLLILFLTSFRTYHPSRNSLLLTLFIQVSLQISMPSFIYSIIGIKPLRILFIVIMIVLLILNSENEADWQRKMTNQLNTPRLQRILTKVLHNQKQIWNSRYHCQGERWAQTRQINEEKENKMIVI